MEMPRPGAAHKELERFAGDWVGEETMHPSQWCPTKTVAQARLVGHIGIDGFYYIGDYEQSCDGKVVFRGHAVHGIDNATGDNLLYWFDSSGAGVNVFRGRLKGNQLVLTEKNAMGHMRLTYTWEGKDRMTNKMEMSQDGETWTPMMDGVYTRKS